MDRKTSFFSKIKFEKLNQLTVRYYTHFQSLLRKPHTQIIFLFPEAFYIFTKTEPYIHRA